MATPFVGEIRMFGFSFAPKDWALCNGETIPIQQNPELYSLISTAYGGNGVTDFMLPDFRGRVPLHRGTLNNDSYATGQKGGWEQVTLTTETLAKHTHLVSATTNDPDSRPNYEGAYFATSDDAKPGTNPGFAYRPATNLVSFNPSSVSSVGQNQPHSNIQPSQVMSFCIALQGAYPSRN